MGVIQFLKIRDLGAARASFREVLSQYPESDVAPDARLMLARIYEEEQGELEKAVREYRYLLEQTDDPVEERAVWMSIADCYYRLDDVDRAKDAYQRVVEDYPYDEESDQAFFRMAQCEGLAGRWEAAGKILRRLLDHSDQPESRYRAFLLASQVSLQSSESDSAYDVARGMLARADREFPDDAEISSLMVRLARQEQDGKSLDDGARDSEALLEELQKNISWGRGRRSRRAR
jgi:tetratricopeptide (TPR) repeat protein